MSDCFRYRPKCLFLFLPLGGVKTSLSFFPIIFCCWKMKCEFVSNRFKSLDLFHISYLIWVFGALLLEGNGRKRIYKLVTCWRFHIRFLVFSYQLHYNLQLLEKDMLSSVIIGLHQPNFTSYSSP